MGLTYGLYATWPKAWLKSKRQKDDPDGTGKCECCGWEVNQRWRFCTNDICGGSPPDYDLKPGLCKCCGQKMKKTGCDEAHCVNDPYGPDPEDEEPKALCPNCGKLVLPAAIVSVHRLADNAIIVACLPCASDETMYGPAL